MIRTITPLSAAPKSFLSPWEEKRKGAILFRTHRRGDVLCPLPFCTEALRGFSAETKLVQDGEFHDAKHRAIRQPIRGNYKCYGFLYRKGSHHHIPAGDELLALGGMEESAWEGFPMVGLLPYRGSSWVSSAVWDQNVSQRSSRHVLRHKRLQREQKHISAVDNYQKEKPALCK